jgi:hypothetical protein
MEEGTEPMKKGMIKLGRLVARLPHIVINASKPTRRSFLPLALLAATYGPLSLTPVTAATFTVKSTLDAPDINPGDGACLTSTGTCTLRAAVEEANALPGQDTINVPSGHYTVTRRVQLKESADINGVDAATTIVSGGTATPIFEVIPSAAGARILVNLRRLTIRDGRTPITVAGAALLNREGATTTLWDSVVRDNESNIYGGGISNWGTLQIVRSEIRNNSLPAGGGGVTSQGGGIFNNGILELYCSAVTENFATRGGGISNTTKGIARIKNSTVSSNRALGGGGGIRNVPGGQLFIAFSTISQNRANEPNDGSEPDRTGGGIQNISTSAGVAILAMSGTILAGNSDNRNKFASDYSPDCYSNSSLTSWRSNLIGVANTQCQIRDGISGTNLSSDFIGTNDVPVNPGLNSLANNGGIARTHALTVGSLAIDPTTTTAGPAFFGCEAADQRGAARPFDGDGNGQATCDMGAYERIALSTPTDPSRCVVSILNVDSPPSAPQNLEVQ